MQATLKSFFRSPFLSVILSVSLFILPLGPATQLALADSQPIAKWEKTETKKTKERPSAEDIFPETTLLYLQVASAKQLYEDSQETNLGRMFRDPEMRPLLGDLYDAATEAFQSVEENLDGVSLEEILDLFQGEIAFAIVDPLEGDPAFAFMIDFGDAQETADKLWNRGKELFQGRSEVSQREIEGITIDVLSGNDDEALLQFTKDGTYVFTNNEIVAQLILNNWAGKPNEQYGRLSDNPKFKAIMKKCEVPNQEPHMTAFVDPIGFFKTVARNEPTMTLALMMLPSLGLDGLEGAGASMTLNTKDFDAVLHAHLALRSPRSGVLNSIALDTGDFTPENWVPYNAASYATLYWDVEKTYTNTTELFDTFQGSGKAAEGLQNLSSEIGVDIETEIIPQLVGRFTHVTWSEPPARINGMAQVGAIQLKDANEFQKVLDTLANQVGLEHRSLGKTDYYFRDLDSDGRGQGEEGDDGRQSNLDLRRPQLCVGIVDDFLLISDSEALLHEAISGSKDPKLSLANEIDFKLTHSKIKRLIGNQKASMIEIDRPDESMRMLYDMIHSDDTQRLLKRYQSSEDSNSFQNRTLETLDGILTENPLPSFEVIKKYLAPGGAILIDDSSGIHYTAFGIRRLPEEDIDRSNDQK
ncbi:MAG: hypothetical protein MPJ24_09500 [Pirellulaceae bacterium]|nr:hypothetical protein [Pirellulaceae bacterium]